MTNLSYIRLQLALTLATEDLTDGDVATKTLILESLCEEEPLVKTVMSIYGII